jgi:membrane protease YdiL (CAAX protease family)
VVPPRGDQPDDERPKPTVVAAATLGVFAFVEFSRPCLLAVLDPPDPAGRRGLLELTLRHYTWYWLPALLLAASFFGPRRALDALGLRGNAGLAVAVGLLCTLPMFLGYAGYGRLSASPTLIADLAWTALLPGVMEEILFRGFLFGFLFRFARWGFLPAAWIGAVLFGIGHLWQGRSAGEMAGVFAITGLGAMWFAWLYVEWGMNLWVPIVFHVLMNMAWDLFGIGESALGDGVANVPRFATLGMSVALTILVARRHGGLAIRGARWWRGKRDWWSGFEALRR